jgi:MFS family permease
MRAWRQSFPPAMTLLLVGFGTALSLTGDTMLYIVLPTHTTEAGIALADVGLMLSANRLIRLFINGPYGILLERIPRRRVLVPSLFIGALSYLLYTVPGFWSLLIGRLLWGAAWAGIWLGGSTAILDIATDENRGRFSGFYQMFFFFGVGCSAILGGILADWLGYVPGLQVSAGIAFVLAVVWLLFLPETRPDTSTRPESGATQQRDAPALTTSTGGPSALPVTRSFSRLVTAIALMGVNWLIFIGIIGATLPLLLQERIGDEFLIAGLAIQLATFTGTLMAVTQTLGLVVSPLSGWLSDRSGNRWGLVVLALVLGALSLAIIAGSGGVVVLVAIMLGAVATGILQTQVMTLIGDYARENRQGRILGVLNTAGDLGSAAGPLLAYALLPLVGLSGIFGLAAALLAVILPWITWIAWREVHSRRHERRMALVEP